MTRNYLDPNYLGDGNQRQRAALAVLHDLAVFERLSAYGPVLAGTIPIAIDTATSDLDVLCEARDLEVFAADVEAAYGSHEGFGLGRLADKQGAPAVKASFTHGGLVVEFFGQARPVTEQHGYRHMVVQARLLDLDDGRFRDAVVALKQSGLKTEPAFAELLGLAGDPYKALLGLESMTDDGLRDLLDDFAEAHGG